MDILRKTCPLIKGDRKMDKNLLNLWQSFSSGNIKIQDLADFLNLSTKQTVRYLHKWMDG